MSSATQAVLSTGVLAQSVPPDCSKSFLSSSWVWTLGLQQTQ